MHSSPFAFTLREDSAKSAYRVQAGADRLCMAVSFDEEDTSDHKTAITPFKLAHSMSATETSSPPPVHGATMPSAAHDDDEVTSVDFALD